MRVLMGEVRASNTLGAAVRVVVLARPRDIVEDNGRGLGRGGGLGRGLGGSGRGLGGLGRLGDGGLVEGMLALLGVGIREGVVGRENIATCDCSTSNVREEECEDECSEVDHRENAGV